MDDNKFTAERLFRMISGFVSDISALLLCLQVFNVVSPLYSFAMAHYDMRETVFGFLRASFWHSVVLLSHPALSCQTISVKCVGWALLIQLQE